MNTNASPTTDTKRPHEYLPAGPFEVPQDIRDPDAWAAVLAATEDRGYIEVLERLDGYIGNYALAHVALRHALEWGIVGVECTDRGAALTVLADPEKFHRDVTKDRNVDLDPERLVTDGGVRDADPGGSVDESRRAAPTPGSDDR